MSQENIRQFCEQHRIRVLDTNKRAHRYQRINMQYFRDPMDFNKVSLVDIVNDSEPLYTVEIAQSELERIADFESEVFNNMRKQGHYRMFETLMEQKEHEKYLKDKYPAVKKAYEHYSLILKLAESGEL
jgi:predicted subunit of tRNA(5-methylaminomethyl-2-thiouridylate) methyltransferase